MLNLQGRPGTQAQGRLILQPESKSSLEAEFPLSWGHSVIFLRPSTD